MVPGAARWRELHRKHVLSVSPTPSGRGARAPCSQFPGSRAAVLPQSPCPRSSQGGVGPLRSGRAPSVTVFHAHALRLAPLSLYQQASGGISRFVSLDMSPLRVRVLGTRVPGGHSLSLQPASPSCLASSPTVLSCSWPWCRLLRGVTACRRGAQHGIQWEGPRLHGLSLGRDHRGHPCSGRVVRAGGGFTHGLDPGWAPFLWTFTAASLPQVVPGLLQRAHPAAQVGLSVATPSSLFAPSCSGYVEC